MGVLVVPAIVAMGVPGIRVVWIPRHRTRFYRRYERAPTAGKAKDYVTETSSSPTARTTSAAARSTTLEVVKRPRPNRTVA